MPELLTIEELCKYTHYKRSSLYRWMKEGTFPKPLKLGERRVRWNKKDVDKWFKKQLEVLNPGRQ